MYHRLTRFRSSIMTSRFVLTALLVTGAACATGCASAGSSSANGAPATKTRVNPDLITAEELADPSVSDGDALLAVRRLRPHFLTTRGTLSVQNPNAGSTHISVNG